VIIRPHIGIGPLTFGMTEAAVEAFLGHCITMEVFFGVRARCSYKGPVRVVVFDADLGAVHYQVVRPGPAELLGVDLFSLDIVGLEQFILSESLATRRIYYDSFGRPGTEPDPLQSDYDKGFEIQLVDLNVRLDIDLEYGVDSLEVRSPRSERHLSDFFRDQ
jgi:hypothetical protein